MGMNQRIQLSDHFTYKRLLRFVMPSIVVMIFSSIYGIVDGIFVSNFAGKSAFAGVNFVMPFIMIMTCSGFLFGTGGSALIGKKLGEGDKEKANNIFSMIVYVTIILNILISIISIIFLKEVCILMGASSSEMLDYCVSYGRIILAGGVTFSLQMEFQSLAPTSEKPKLGMIFTILAGVTNMILDWLFVGIFKWSVEGAAVATVIAQCVGGLGPIIYFALPNTSLLRLGKFYFNGKELIQICSNGISELIGNISMSLVGMLYNIQLIKYAGENGVAAYGVLMYVVLIFLSIFIGFAMGTAPVVSFNFGSGNTDELKNVFKKCASIIIASSLLMAAISYGMARPMSKIFTSYDQELYELTVKGFKIYSFSFLFSGISIYSSSLFTALNNGKISAIISFCRTVVFQVGFVLLLPLIAGINGIWWSIVLAELFGSILSLACLYLNHDYYHYI